MSGATPTTSDAIEFKDEKFEVIPAPGKVTSPQQGQDTAEAASPVSGPSGAGSSGMDYTEEDLLFITETFWNIPCIFLDKIPPRDPEKVKKFNAQFYRYCRKKGINPWDYFFDEFPLAMAGIGMGMGIWRDYKEQYKSGNNGKKESKEDKKLSSDYEHEKQVAEQKEKDLKSGVISSAAGAPEVPAAAPGG